MAASATSHLMQAVADPDNLLRAWSRVRDNDLADGSMSDAGERFARGATVRLTELGEALRSGMFVPSPLTRVELPKGDGSTRILGIPAVPDRVVERAVTQVLGPVLDPWFSPWSFAYRPGLGVADAVRTVVRLREEGGAVVVRADFRDCFDRLQRSMLLEDLADRLSGEEASDLLTLIEGLLERPLRVAGRLEHRTVGVTQGGPLSPLLCNLLLTRFDGAMLGRGWPAIRYADDVAVVVRSRGDAAEAVGALREEAARVALDLAEDKTDVREFSEGFVFLGEDVNHRYPEELPHELRPAPDQRTLYVGRQGATVRLDRGQVVVTRRSTRLLEVPMSLVSHLVVFGSVVVTPAVIAVASRSGWSIVWLSRRGWLHGWLEGPDPSRAALRRQQYRSSEDPSFRLEMARRFVAGKLANQRALLARYVRRDAIPRVVGAIGWLDDARRTALVSCEINELLGVEGSAARVYFDALGELMPEWCQFDGRTRQPPTDPGNAVLSYLYTVVTGDAVTATLTAGLDPAAGFLHADHGRRPSLACDLLEEFRASIVDTVALELFRRGSLEPEQFERDERSGAVMMKERARKKAISALEDRLLTVFAHVPSGKRVSYRRALFLQAQQIARCVRTGEVDYRAVSWR